MSTDRSRCWTRPSVSTVSGPASLRVPAAVLAASLESADPRVVAALRESIARARLGHAAQLPDRIAHRDRPRRLRRAALGPGVPRRPVRARRARAVPVERGDERGAGAGRGCRGHRRDLAGAADQRRLAGSERAGRLRPARRRRGLLRRRRPGHRAAGVRRGRHRRHRHRAGRRHHRPRQRLRDRGQAAGPRAGGHRLRGRSHGDRGDRRCVRVPGPRGRRPRSRRPNTIRWPPPC